tara:strand:- start:151 stop:642 length:492 start_codon:yes stop_codon:yes gene_type:complete
MSGYDYAAGMSNNAVDAYVSGLKPLSRITSNDLRIAGWKGTKKLAQSLAQSGAWPPAEWHHTSSFYNEVNFYDPGRLVEIWSEMSPAERDEAETRAKPATVEQGRQVFGSYIVWGGTRRRPHKLGDHHFKGILIGDWIYLENGKRKKASGNSISWRYAIKEVA